MEQPIQLNEHNKQEYPPMHTAEHLLNQTMVRLFGCKRSSNAHIERKKSKISFTLPICPTEEQVQQIVNIMNELIQQDLRVNYEFCNRNELPDEIEKDRLPIDASDVVRLVRIGNYDMCPCIGTHVEHTGQIGKFILLGTNWDDSKHNFRIRFKLEANSN